MMKRILVFCLILAAIPVYIYSAGTTGKIVGTVKDKETGEPLMGANVILEGTLLGVATDVDGYYMILNVPVGSHDVKVTYMGYRPIVEENVRVSVDLTTEVDFEMETTTLTGETIVVTAERSMIRKDETNTNIIRTAEEIEVMPIRGMQNISSTIAGVVKQDNESDLNIRGGRSDESAIYVDGVLINDPYNYAVRAYIPNEAIEELSVQTGGFNAEYGEAMSGIIIMTTNSGTKRYSGSVQVITDEFLESQYKRDYLDTYSYGFNEYNATLGGPIVPGLRHTFFFSGTRRWLQDGAPSWGWAENENKPSRFRGGIIPGQTDESWSYTGKVKLQLMKSMELKGSVVWTDRSFGFTGDWSGMNPIWLYDVEHAPQTSTEHRSYNATLTHTLGPTTFYDLKFNYYDTFRKFYDRMFEDDIMKYGDPTYVPDAEWANNEANYGTRYIGAYEPDLLKPGSQFHRYLKNKTTYWGVHLDMIHQQGKYNSFKLGFDFKRHTLRKLQFWSPNELSSKATLTEVERYRLADVENYGYDIFGNEVNDGDYKQDVKYNDANIPISGYRNQAPVHPITMSAYIQDKIEFEDIVLNLGLRYDRIDPNAWQFRQIEAEYDADGNYIQGTGMFRGDERFDAGDVEDSEAYDFLSPRFGVSFPVSDRTIFHGQFGKFYQKPSLQDLYLSPFYLDAWVKRGGYFTLLNNPNLRPEKTTAYEIGFKQMLSENASIQLSAFYKETEDLIQALSVQTDITTIAFMSNGDFGVIKGFDIIFNLRRWNNISANLNYEFQIANGTGTASDSNFEIAWIRGGRGHYPKFTQPLEFEQRHTGTMYVDYRLGTKQGPQLFGIYPFEKTGVNLLFTFNSGRRFTRMRISNTNPHAGRWEADRDISQIPVSAVSGETQPWNYRFDLKVDRTFQVPYLPVSMNLYLWVLNVLNTKTTMYVWPTTGLADDTGYLATAAGQEYYAGLEPDEKLNFSMREQDFINYGIPRQIRLGVRLEF